MGAAIAGGIGSIAGSRIKQRGAELQNPNFQKFLSAEDTDLLRAGRERFDVSTQDLERRSIAAADQAQAGLGFIQRGELDPASQALISQNVDRNRRLQAARQASLASQFGAGTALSNILGRQGSLKADLATNQQSFGAFRDQIARQRSQEQGLQNILGLRGTGVAGLGQSLQAQQRTAQLRGGQEGFGGAASNIVDAIDPAFGSVGGLFFGGQKTGRLS